MQGLTTAILGRNIIEYEEIDSTQLEILRRIEKGSIQDGTVVVSKLQTNGIGTHGRTWYTDTGNDIAFSLVVMPNCNIAKLENISLQVAKDMVKVFENLYGIKLEIKEPNDIMINCKKIGGILTQTKLKGEIVKYLVVGIGINTNKTDFAKEIEESATSIKKEYNIDVDNEKVIVAFFNIFENTLKRMVGKI